MQDREHRRHENQRQHGRHGQAAHHGDRHGRAKLAAIAIGQRSREHARDHGDGSHDDRAGALAAGFDQRLRARHAARHFLDRKVDQHDGVFGDDAHEHENADDNRHRYRSMRRQQRHDGAADGQREREENGDRLHETGEQQDQHAIDKHQAGAHRSGEGAEDFAHDFGVAGLLDFHSWRQVLRSRQILNRLGCFAQGRLTMQIGFEQNAARAIIAVDRRRSAAH